MWLGIAWNHDSRSVGGLDNNRRNSVMWNKNGSELIVKERVNKGCTTVRNELELRSENEVVVLEQDQFPVDHRVQQR